MKTNTYLEMVCDNTNDPTEKRHIFIGRNLNGIPKCACGGTYRERDLDAEQAKQTLLVNVWSEKGQP